jgi:penicillin-binding protein 2
MKKKRKEQRELSGIMSRRVLMLGVGQALLGGVLVARLYDLQISQNASYKRLSDRNQFDQRLVQAPRGRLFDAQGRLLAGNSEIFELLVVPSRVDDLDQLLTHIGQIVPLRPIDIEIAKKTISRQPDFLEVTIRSNLSQRELARLAILSLCITCQ